MDWKDEEYLRRVDQLSDDTMQLISEMNTKNKILQTVKIIMETDTEKEVVEQLHQLKEETEKM